MGRGARGAGPDLTDYDVATTGYWAVLMNLVPVCFTSKTQCWGYVNNCLDVGYKWQPSGHELR